MGVKNKSYVLKE